MEFVVRNTGEMGAKVGAWPKSPMANKLNCKKRSNISCYTYSVNNLRRQLNGQPRKCTENVHGLQKSVEGVTGFDIGPVLNQKPIERQLLMTYKLFFSLKLM
jgi:hypothetical protein